MIYFTFKEPERLKEIQLINPLLGIVLFDMAYYCYIRKLPMTITSMIRTFEENKAMNAKSSTHVEGRAFDLSIKGWDLFKIDEFCQHFNSKYIEFAKPLVICHEGTAAHIHVQVFRDAKIEV